MAEKKRLECLLFEQGLAQSREKARAMIMAGNVYVDNQKSDKPGTMLPLTAKIEVRGAALPYVSRGGLKLEKDPLTALHQILHPQKLRRLKIGQTISPSGCRSAFCVSSGIGFDAAVCNGAYRSGMKDMLNWFHLGKLVYTGTALKQLFTSRLCPMKLTLDDGQELVYPHAFFAAVMNLPYEGGGFRFAPDADPCSDRFTLCIAEGLSKPRILSILPLAFSGRHVGKSGIHLITCKRVVIQTGHPLCVHTDGEIFGFHEEVTFEAHPERLNVIVA